MAYRVNTAISFWHFIKKYAVEIPIIQRDYAQGRLGKEYMRYNFLTNLKQALDGELPNGERILTLDFVYGSQNEDNSKTYPLDGQQRLTTLWLLHWYIALKAGKLEDACGMLKNFSYETRISSREFCQELCNYSNFREYNDNSGIIGFITSRTWFYSFWKQDPTIQAMLRMIGGTKINSKYGNDIVDGLEELFRETSLETFKCYWKALISDNAPVVFYYLPLENFGLTDDLYIKMNARGKQLTSFENFKADFIGHIKEQAKECDEWKVLLDPQKGIPIKLDTTWTDIFWKYHANNEELDRRYFAFLNRYLLNCAIIYHDATEESEAWKLYGEKSNDSFLLYDSGFHIYSSILSGPKGLVILHNIERLFDNFAKIGNVNEYLPRWFKKFDFIPAYTGQSISKLTLPQRVVFLGVCRYFESCADFNEIHFRRWMRVVCNLVENTAISTIDAMIARMKLIDELSAHVENIYEYLADESSTIKSKASPEQLSEEIEKARQILNPQDAELPEKPGDWDDGKPWNWETAVSEAEGDAFFNGSIRFMFRNKDSEWDWSNFSKKWKNSQTLFSDNGLYKKDSILLCYFISKFTEWEMFWGITFDTTQSTWHSVLLNKKWSDPVHEVLISDRIAISEDYYSNLPEVMQEEVQHELVTSNLLDCIEEGCYLNYRYGKYVLYPYNVKADWKKYVIADIRNRILSSLYGGKLDADKQSGKIYTDQKIDGCNFFWGWNIHFIYVCDNVEYAFCWQNWNWIDMYEDDNRLVDYEELKDLTINGSKIKGTDDFVKSMNQCIERYKESKNKSA